MHQIQVVEPFNQCQLIRTEMLFLNRLRQVYIDSLCRYLFNKSMLVVLVLEMTSHRVSLLGKFFQILIPLFPLSFLFFPLC